MIDRRWRLFGRVSLIDVLLVALFAAVIAFMITISRPAEAAADTPQSGNFTFTVELSCKDAGYEDNVEIGARVYDNLKGIYLGTVRDVEVRPYKSLASDQQAGIWRESEVEGLNFVYVTVEGDAVRTDMTTTVNDVEVVVGKELFIRSGRFASGGYCVKTEYREGAGR